ncbi:hypothetical protein FIBSPDRAFT_109675 [Athelia psychrophila]|uniref:Uncharacterized protein n=1 Tax=Athelia psychrophila TaxID=1759441 RepID=A0A166TDC0_9AGAM|nr:hypothetical protein FIBSPDRAFT_109675 [Fibularhizoctonia sp. CBS 109695]
MVTRSCMIMCCVPTRCEGPVIRSSLQRVRFATPSRDMEHRGPVIVCGQSLCGGLTTHLFLLQGNFLETISV